MGARDDRRAPHHGLGKAEESQLKLADVALHAQPPRLRRLEAQVDHHVPDGQGRRWWWWWWRRRREEGGGEGEEERGGGRSR